MNRITCIATFALSAVVLAATSAPVDAGALAHWRFETGPDETAVTHGAANGFPNYAPDVADASGNGNELSMWQTGGGTGFSYDSDVPGVPTASASNNFSIQNTNSFPASFTEPGGPLSSVELSAWTVEVSWKPENGGFRTVVGRNADEAANGAFDTQLSAFYLGANPSNEFLVRFIDEDGFVHEITGGSVSGFAFGSDPEGATGTWYNIAATSDGSTMSLYVDSGAGYSLIDSLDLTLGGSTNTALTNGITDEGGSAGVAGSWEAGGWTVGYGLYNGGHVDRAFGFIDEVRISDMALSPSAFLFAQAVIPAPAALPAGFALIGLAAIRRRR